MHVLAFSSDAWAGLVGALIGGCFTLLGQMLSHRFERRKLAREKRDQVAATALLIQDDFVHYQATLARSLDRSTWWKPAELSQQQASIEDRRTVWAALPDAETRTVADAQGWMDYLIRLREDQSLGTPALAPADTETMRMTFGFLEAGRKALADLARRPATPFEKTRVLEELTNCRTVEDLLGRRA
jgi:hypothetical protein